MPCTRTWTSCGALPAQGAKLQTVEAREDRGLFEWAAKATLMQEDSVCGRSLQRVGAIEVGGHITAEWLFPRSCAAKVGEDEVNKIRGVLGYCVAVDRVGIVRVPTRWQGR